MRKRTLTLPFLAALLSVVSIPVVAALASRNQSSTWVIIGTAASIAAGIATFLFSTATYLSAEKKATKTAGKPPENTIIYVEGPAEIRLLRELGVTEREAQALLGEGTSTSVIRLRSLLLEAGVWSENDVYDFDIALRTRNEIAHGTQEDLSRTSINQAIETMRRLRRKVEASQSLER